MILIFIEDMYFCLFLLSFNIILSYMSTYTYKTQCLSVVSLWIKTDDLIFVQLFFFYVCTIFGKVKLFDSVVPKLLCNNIYLSAWIIQKEKNNNLFCQWQSWYTIWMLIGNENLLKINKVNQMLSYELKTV